MINKKEQTESALFVHELKNYSIVFLQLRNTIFNYNILKIILIVNK